MPEASKSSTTVTLAQLLDGPLAALRAEARRRRDRAGLRPADVDVSAESLRELAARYRSALLPAAPKIAETLLEVLLSTKDSLREADDKLWATAADCAVRWPGAFREFCIALLAEAARKGLSGSVGSLDPASGTLESWTIVLLSCAGCIAGSPELREYAENAVTRWQVDPDLAGAAGHIDLLVAMLRPSSAALNSFALRVADRCGRHSDAAVAVVGHRLRLTVSAVCHPRCAPLHVPLVAPERSSIAHALRRPAEGPVPVGDEVRSTEELAVPSRRFTEAPAVTSSHWSGERQIKSVRTESTTTVRTLAGRATAGSVGFEVPDIVDDDLE